MWFLVPLGFMGSPLLSGLYGLTHRGMGHLYTNAAAKSTKSYFWLPERSPSARALMCALSPWERSFLRALKVRTMGDCGLAMVGRSFLLFSSPKGSKLSRSVCGAISFDPLNSRTSSWIFCPARRSFSALCFFCSFCLFRDSPERESLSVPPEYAAYD